MPVPAQFLAVCFLACIPRSAFAIFQNNTLRSDSGGIKMKFSTTFQTKHSEPPQFMHLASIKYSSGRLSLGLSKSTETGSLQPGKRGEPIKIHFFTSPSHLDLLNAFQFATPPFLLEINDSRAIFTKL